MKQLYFTIARSLRNAIALLGMLASACGSDGMPHAPIDDFTSGRSSTNTEARPARDAGTTEIVDEAEAEAADDDEAAGDDGDKSAKAEVSADAGTAASKDARVGDDTVAAPGQTESCDALTYESFGKQFVEAYCTECHNSATKTSGLGGVILDTLPMIVKNKMYLKRTVAPRTDGRPPPMPKGGNPMLTDEERTKFGAWIDCGPI